MKYFLRVFFGFICALFVCSHQAVADTSDCLHLLSSYPMDNFLWLEEVEGERALKWVEQQNARTIKVLESQPVYAKFSAKAKEILFAKDRAPFSGFARGYFWNFWTDQEHTHGVLRRTTREEYTKAEPQWEIILDLDQLSRDENENWVYGGRQRLQPNSSRYLLNLSRGGKDAVVTREFDVSTGQFIPDGFNVPEGKNSLTPLDEDTVLIGKTSDEWSVTSSGYPRVIHLWHRGEALEKAKPIFEVLPSDLSASAMLLHDFKRKHVILMRNIAFYNTEYFLRTPGGQLRQLQVPRSSAIFGIKRDKIYLRIKEDTEAGGKHFSANSLLRIDLNASGLENAEVVFQAGKNQSIQNLDLNDETLFVTVLDNILSRVIEIELKDGAAFHQRQLPLPTTGILNYTSPDDEDPTSFASLYYTDHLTPYAQYAVDEESHSLTLLKSERVGFDSSPFTVTQKFATSADGTKIPYFVLHKKDLELNGRNPTLMYGYGGFEISMTPHYSAMIGKLWLEQGGVYVIANIRGGAEFGPDWHRAALKENRQRAYDDFISVAEDLIAAKITAPAHLGISGGSNGGLLTGAVMVQRPELFNGVISAVPLLDMARFSKLLAGASWMGEYGNPEVASELQYLLKYSPYQNLKSDVEYPAPFFTTSTKDDRVHPGHARKMAARMEELGHPFYYYENVNGGHNGAANLDEQVKLNALEYTYMWMRLSGEN